MIPSANLLRILLVPLTIISSKEKKVCFHSSPLKNTAKTLDIKRLPSTVTLVVHTSWTDALISALLSRLIESRKAAKV